MSWVLTILGIVGFFVVSTGDKRGWLLNFSVQPIWLVYSLETKQYGFVLASVFYAWVFWRNWRRA